MPKKMFTKETLLDILGGDKDCGSTVLNEIMDKRRWSVDYRFVFKSTVDDKFYEAQYSIGATEQQDERPWEYEKEVECTEVEPYVRAVHDYKPVD